ncbi:P-type conjugative transfer protein TrbL [Halomonas eurihalina]|uniref:P-type conjugative transfer protein TrbL n=1 Tax=Halomonas eurihalina TaxID=42566 RepID=A0A5D9DEI9_HALER|nr:P-type conjugative transfer protein TrbL [Halomonas eurihalina]MDR5857967.1 P-type conjugative transfer protein TrbL [Halomonas eurihalina]TZG41520.1 P-type conjugative transfer protein TrbL [Halomonas eurihalina]
MSKLGCRLFVLSIAALMIPEVVSAQELNSSGVMNDVLHRFYESASTWSEAIESAASRLFWMLVAISMVWTFGIMAVRRADFGEFFAEAIKFIVFTGFFWWILTNAVSGLNIAGTIVDSLQHLGVEAGGLANGKLGPSEVVDLGFQLYDRTIEATKELGWRQFGTKIAMEGMAIAILVVLAIVAVNLLLLLVSTWILLYAGVFFLGFGGSRWTSDIAINYYRSILNIAAQLLAMVLIVAIGKTFLEHYYDQMSDTMASQELAVMLVVSICLLFLVNKVPPLVAGIASGGGSAASAGIGNISTGSAMGAAMGAASVASTAAAMSGKALMSGASNAAGGASALKSAFQAAQNNVSSGGDVMSRFSGGGGGMTPPMGGGQPGAGPSGGGPSSGKSAFGDDLTDSMAAPLMGSDNGGGSSSSGGSMSRAGRIAADTGANLAKGTFQVARDNLKGNAQNRVNQTMGGKVANAIRQSSQANSSSPGSSDSSGSNDKATSFDGDSIGGQECSSAEDGESAFDPKAEIAAFRDKER